jgi:hypothetical protein
MIEVISRGMIHQRDLINGFAIAYRACNLVFAFSPEFLAFYKYRSRKLCFTIFKNPQFSIFRTTALVQFVMAILITIPGQHGTVEYLEMVGMGLASISLIYFSHHVNLERALQQLLAPLKIALDSSLDQPTTPIEEFGVLPLHDIETEHAGRR